MLYCYFFFNLQQDDLFRFNLFNEKYILQPLQKSFEFDSSSFIEYNFYQRISSILISVLFKYFLGLNWPILVYKSILLCTLSVIFVVDL